MRQVIEILNRKIKNKIGIRTMKRRDRKREAASKQQNAMMWRGPKIGSIDCDYNYGSSL